MISTARFDDRVRFRDDLVGSPPASRHRHHESECALSPVSAANSFALSPLSFQRSTRFAHVSRTAGSIATSCHDSYANADRKSVV